jgi:hypothetical protein
MSLSSYQIQARAEIERRKRLGLIPKEKPLWEPNPDRDGIPNPQRLAYESEADVLGFGGGAGSGKTSLLLGLAATKHKRSAIFRRTFPELRGIIEDSRKIFNAEEIDHTKDSFNESLHRWSLDGGKRMVEFESCQLEKDKRKQQGRARDFFGFDEAQFFTKEIIEYITIWNRTTDPNQRCRVVLTFNPPTEDQGQWVIDYFKPWLAYLFPDAYQHPSPAKPGELRWYTSIDGEEVECENDEPIEYNGETLNPRSRTFIPGTVFDNPYLLNTDYVSQLQRYEEPYRSMFLFGNFAAKADPNPLQVIPSAWVLKAQQRWRETEKPNIPINAIGIDVARGGRDKTTLAKRRENYFDELLKWPGSKTPDGQSLITVVKPELDKEDFPETINVDAIGVGSSPYDMLKETYDFVSAINVAEASTFRDRSNRHGMKNKRSEMYWRMREALDPEHGDNLCLPPDNELLADLCAATYSLTSSGQILIEEKKKIKERIGRSPDLGECVLLTMLDGSKWLMGWE